MIIYRAYLDYGPYDGESVLGYFESVASSYRAITKSCKEHGLYLDQPIKEGDKTIYRVLDTDKYWFSDYLYIIQTIEVRP